MLTFGLAFAQSTAPAPTPLHRYEYAYLVPGEKPVWVEPTRTLEGAAALCEAMLGTPKGCTDYLDQFNALGAQGWFPVAGLLTDPRTGIVYFYREVK